MKWISVEVDRPLVNQQCLVFTNQGLIQIRKFCQIKFAKCKINGVWNKVTHWMPLPKPPID